MNTAISLENVTVAYRRHPALHHLSGSFKRASLTAVIGPNGAGKSSLLNAITGAVPLSDGRVSVAPDLQPSLAYLPQRTSIDRSFPIRVDELVQLGSWRKTGPFGRVSRAMRDAADHALAAVGLEGFGARLVGELSAGQFQRVLFARLLLQDAQLILLDEPFNAVDERTTADMLALVQRWHGEGRTVIAVLHDMAQVRAHFPEALLLAREQISWGPTAEVLDESHLAHARRLSMAWDEEAAFCVREAA
ncbi:ABC transporter ATP-binding protein [Uliginosibacterium sediminicola]|uniref:ABC transporter ATP-binding protein n=1 Tax=Uliginosibacterium sediminicola TaxID=2024550 RepID=A0ABU9Z1D3_9RHOO